MLSLAENKLTKWNYPTTFLHLQRSRISGTVLTVKISSFTDYDKEDRDSADNTRHYQGDKKPFEEKRSRSSSFVSSIDDEQKPLFPGIMDYPSIMDKAAVLDFEEMVHVTERIQAEKRSHSCKGNLCKTYSHLRTHGARLIVCLETLSLEFSFCSDTSHSGR